MSCAVKALTRRGPWKLSRNNSPAARAAFSAASRCCFIGKHYVAQRIQSARLKTHHRIVIPSEVEESRCKTSRRLHGILRLHYAPLRMTHPFRKARTKETGREINFSSRVEVRVVTPKKFGAVNTATGLMPLFLRCFFLCCFFLCHRLIPPFQSATRGAL